LVQQPGIEGNGAYWRLLPRGPSIHALLVDASTPQGVGIVDDGPAKISLCLSAVVKPIPAIMNVDERVHYHLFGKPSVAEHGVGEAAQRLVLRCE
jgi:hypothetical protein